MIGFLLISICIFQSHTLCNDIKLPNVCLSRVAEQLGMKSKLGFITDCKNLGFFQI